MTVADLTIVERELRNYHDSGCFIYLASGACDCGMSPPTEALEAHKRVEAEIARLEQENEEADKALIQGQEAYIALGLRAEAAGAEIARLRDGLRYARRDIDNMGRWAAHPNEPTARDWALVVTECEQSLARIDALLAEDGAA